MRTSHHRDVIGNMDLKKREHSLGSKMTFNDKKTPQNCEKTFDEISLPNIPFSDNFGILEGRQLPLIDFSRIGYNSFELIEHMARLKQRGIEYQDPMMRFDFRKN